VAAGVVVVGDMEGLVDVADEVEEEEKGFGLGGVDGGGLAAELGFGVFDGVVDGVLGDLGGPMGGGVLVVAPVEVAVVIDLVVAGFVGVGAELAVEDVVGEAGGGGGVLVVEGEVLAADGFVEDGTVEEGADLLLGLGLAVVVGDLGDELVAAGVPGLGLGGGEEGDSYGEEGRFMRAVLWEEFARFWGGGVKGGETVSVLRAGHGEFFWSQSWQNLWQRRKRDWSDGISSLGREHEWVIRSR
jgi:hypothetical protein